MTAKTARAALQPRLWIVAGSMARAEARLMIEAMSTKIPTDLMQSLLNPKD